MATCQHPGAYPAQACTHLLVDDHEGYVEAFTGRGIEHVLLCTTCAAANDRSHVVLACPNCERFARIGWTGIIGTPGIVVAPSSLALRTVEVELADCPAELADLCPLGGADRERWLAVAPDARIYELDLEAGTARYVASAPADVIEEGTTLEIHASRDGSLAAVCSRRGKRGAVIELASGRVTLPLPRDGYHTEHCDFPFAFVDRGGRTLAIHAPAWNRLEVNDARTGELLSARDAMTYHRGDARPEHYLDYFHCTLTVSPGNTRIADAGWVWGPWGVVTAWSVERWLDDNPFESEDGPTRQRIAGRDYFWNGPQCWLDDTRLAVWGYGGDDEWLVDGVMIFDAATGEMTSWFAGPARGTLAFDRYLHVLDGKQLTLWDPASGARVLEAATSATRYHPSGKHAVSLPIAGLMTVSRVVGEHANAAWRTPTIVELAASLASSEDLEHGLTVLGDALEAAGCDAAELLAHCREPGPHGSHCWVLDRLG